MKAIINKIVDKLSTKAKVIPKKTKLPSPTLEEISKKYFFGGH